MLTNFAFAFLLLTYVCWACLLVTNVFVAACLVRNDWASDGTTVTERATTAASTMTVAALGVDSLFFNN